MSRAQNVNKHLTKTKQIEDLTWLYIDDFDDVEDESVALRLIKEFTEDWHKIRFGDYYSETYNTDNLGHNNS